MCHVRCLNHSEKLTENIILSYTKFQIDRISQLKLNFVLLEHSLPYKKCKIIQNNP